MMRFVNTSGPVPLTVVGSIEVLPGEVVSWRWRHPGGVPKVVEDGRYVFLDEGRFEVGTEVTGKFGTVRSEPVTVTVAAAVPTTPPPPPRRRAGHERRPADLP